MEEIKKNRLKVLLVENRCSFPAQTQYQAGGEVADRSTPSVTCTGVGVGPTVEDALALADVDAEAVTVGAGGGLTGSGSHQS